MGINKQIIYSLVALFGAIIFFQITTIDIYLQDNFYNFSKNIWILHRDTQPWKFIFYDGIKRLLIFIAIVFLILIIFFRNHTKVIVYKKGILLIILASIFIPLLVGGLKKNTNMPCPKNEIHYGGKMIRTKIWEKYPEPYKSMQHIACWPAGHASGGFVLMSLYFLFKTKRNKLIGFTTGITVGWSMGVYKMSIGDHFFSHTFITMLISWICILFLYKLINHFIVSEELNFTTDTIISKEKH